ncbi:MFS transporter [Desulfobacterota bacterium AH_259_B03_O07]|nr:MFS transporter [Desulfobacterota bacterium AH_259_B03_O07]
MERSANTNAHQKNPHLLYIAAGFASLGGFLFGYDSSVISGAILFIKKQFSLSSSMEEVIISSLFLSAMVGAPVGGVLADKVGRRKVLILTGVLFALGSFGAALSPTVTFLIISRFVMGVSLGMVSVTSPIYISELANVSSRGWMVSFYALSITIGTLVSYIINLAFTGDSAWRWMFAIGAIPAIMLGIGMVFLPETPRWLLSHSFPDKARSVLKKGIRHLTE